MVGNVKQNTCVCVYTMGPKESGSGVPLSHGQSDAKQINSIWTWMQLNTYTLSNWRAQELKLALPYMTISAM